MTTRRADRFIDELQETTNPGAGSYIMVSDSNESDPDLKTKKFDLDGIGGRGDQGNRGPRGTDGRDCYQGEWASGNSYLVGDRVSRGTVFYDCITANSDTNFTLANWSPARGPAGAMGEAGEQGPAGTSPDTPHLMVQTLTSAFTIPWDVESGYSALLTIEHNATLNITGGSAGFVAMLTVTQDTTGSRTLSLGTIPRFADVGAPTLKPAAGAVTLLSFVNIAGTWNYLGVR